MQTADARVDFHKGETLFTLASVYPTLSETIEEQVQNALDAGAVTIEIYIDFQSRECQIRDNGQGVDTEMFHQALHSVGKGIKTKDKLGRFGLGLISPLGKCSKFTFTSCAAPAQKGYQTWAFESNVLRRMHRELIIPRNDRTDLFFSKDEKNEPTLDVYKIWWRTQVKMFEVTKDRALSDMNIESLKMSILDKYSATMRRQKTKVTIIFIDEAGRKTKDTFIGRHFAGKQLDQVVITSKSGAKTYFNLYVTNILSRHKSKKLNILFGEADNDFRIATTNFLRSTACTLLSDEIKEAFRSGVFEGEILSDRATFNPSRKSFKTNEDLIDFCVAIEDWFLEHGQQHLDQEKQKREATRYQKLGIASMAALEKILKSPDNEHLLRTLKESIKLGSIGMGHAPKKSAGTQDAKSLSTNGKPGIPRPEKTESDRVRPLQPETDKPGHIPGTVQGPEGQKRTLVKSDSMGLQFAFADTGATLWEFDTSTGTIYFNTTHPTWVACDNSDYKLKVLMESVAIQAITLEIMPDPTYYQHQKHFADKCLDLTIQLLLSGGAISRTPSNR